MKSLSTVLLISLLMFACSLPGSTSLADNSDPTVVPTVDLQKYSGVWREIAHSPNFFQGSCVRSTAEYAVVAKDKISVHNVCFKANNRTSDIQGFASIPDMKVPAKLRVRFNFFARGDYWITYLDPDYQWAVVSGPHKSSIFILARQAPMDLHLQSHIIRQLDLAGYDTAHLIYDKYSSTEESPSQL